MENQESILFSIMVYTISIVRIFNPFFTVFEIFWDENIVAKQSLVELVQELRVPDCLGPLQ